MAQHVIDLCLTIEDNMPAHKLFQRPVLTTHPSHESTRALGLGIPGADAGGVKSRTGFDPKRPAGLQARTATGTAIGKRRDNASTPEQLNQASS